MLNFAIVKKFKTYSGGFDHISKGKNELECQIPLRAKFRKF